MVRLILGVFLFGAVIFLSGCSVIDDFLIVNDSDASLKVGLKWKEGLLTPLRIFTFDRFNGRKFERLEPLSDVAMGFAEERDEILVTLQPRQALHVHRVREWSQEHIRKMVDSDYRIYEIDLNGSKGNVRLTGEQTWFQFQRLDNGYFLVYR